MPEEKQAEVTETTTDPFKQAMFGDLGKETFGEEVTESPEVEPDEVAEEDAVEPADTETETEEESDTETDTGEKSDETPESGLLQELHLDGQYKTVKDALQAVTHQRKELEDRNNELFILKTLVANLQKDKPKPVPEVGEELTDEEKEQAAWFDKMAKKRGYIRADDIAPIKESVDNIQAQRAFDSVAATIDQHEDLRDVAAHFRRTQEAPKAGMNKRWDAMQAQLEQHPALRAISATEAVEVLYKLTEPKVGGKPKVPAVSQDKKKAADTSAPGRGGQRVAVPSDFAKWGSAKQLAWAEEHGLVD